MSERLLLSNLNGNNLIILSFCLNDGGSVLRGALVGLHANPSGGDGEVSRGEVEQGEPLGLCCVCLNETLGGVET